MVSALSSCLSEDFAISYRLITGPFSKLSVSEPHGKMVLRQEIDGPSGLMVCVHSLWTDTLKWA